MNYIREKLLLDDLHNNDMLGQGVTIAILDTGIYPHIDFLLKRNRLVDFIDIAQLNNINIKSKSTLATISQYNNLYAHIQSERSDKNTIINSIVDVTSSDFDYETLIQLAKQPYDNNGHGTAVAGILCGSGLVSNDKYKGVAPLSKICAIKAINDNGEGEGKNILLGMQYIFDNIASLGIKIACMSFGSNIIDPDPFILGAEALWNSGVVVVASSGNDGPEQKTIKSPAASPKILAVGGIDYDELGKPFVTKFSSRGPFGKFTRPDIVAPAVKITTTNKVGNYQPMSGTSMAAPIVAGIVACILSKYPNYTPDKIKELLITNTIVVDDNKNASGNGLIDIPKLLNKLPKKY